MVSICGKPTALALLDGRAEQPQQEHTGTSAHHSNCSMHKITYPALASCAFQALANIDPILYYGLMSAEAEESIWDGEKARWLHEPKGAKVHALVFGELAKAGAIAIFESQWDAITLFDKLNFNPFACHGRGGQGKLCHGRS